MSSQQAPHPPGPQCTARCPQGQQGRPEAPAAPAPPADAAGLCAGARAVVQRPGGGAGLPVHAVCTSALLAPCWRLLAPCWRLLALGGVPGSSLVGGGAALRASRRSARAGGRRLLATS